MPEDKVEIKQKGARKVEQVGEIRLYECPLTITTQETANMLELVFLTSESNVLPFPGNWLAQPFWFVECFKLYRSEKAIFNKETSNEG